MDAVRKLETRLADLYAKLPALPSNGSAWLAQNAWWIVLILGILDIIGCISIFNNYIGTLATNANTTIYNVGYAGYVNVVSVIGLVANIVVTVLLLMAVKPLKDMRLRGWNLVFGAQVVTAAFAVVAVIITIIASRSAGAVTGSILGLAVTLLFVAIWLYFLFQVRPDFEGRVNNAVEAEIVEDAPKR